MKMPNSKQMSKEQKKIYLDAPLCGTVLVTGPPGTGKTVIAFLRAKTLTESDKKVTVAMYNKVLRSYTSNIDEKIAVSTLHQWVYNWWRRVGIGRYDLNVSYSEKDSARELGARWDNRKKKWWVTPEIYAEKKDKLERWSPRLAASETPTLPNDKYSFDWNLIVDLIDSALDKDQTSLDKISWGHLIIDEAQDFSPEMFRAMRAIRILAGADPCTPALTIFADENQRIGEQNSTITDIINNLGVKNSHQFALTKNYRNTREIAELASFFYVGLTTGIPDLPEKAGDTPVLLETKDLDQFIQYLSIYIRNHEDQEIGIIVKTNSTRIKVFEKLSKELDGLESVIFQTYAGNDSALKASDLVFDKDTNKKCIVSVFNHASCKGLEFDAVFIPELQDWPVDPAAIDAFKMAMYVAVSRARDHLVLGYSNSGASDLKILEYLPAHNSNLIDFEKIK